MNIKAETGLEFGLIKGFNGVRFIWINESNTYEY